LGSQRQNSSSFIVAKYLQKYLTQFDKTIVALLNIREFNLPLLDRVFSTVENASNDLNPLGIFFKSNVFVIVLPEYNGMYPASVQNLFDHSPRQKQKVYGIATASNGSLGVTRCSQ
jgi:NAD(P)H-dependent FMN reductase